MIVEERRLRIIGTLDRVPVACSFVVDAARQSGLEEDAVYHCQLAVDEACTNIVEHSYRRDGAEYPIEVVCRFEGARFYITVIDDGPAFDPLARLDPDPAATLDAREPGGWGIYFIKQVMDEITYEFEENRNHLVMMKRVGVSAHMNDSSHHPTMLSMTSTPGNQRVITPHGRLDAPFSRTIESLIHQQFGAGYRHFILDLSDVEYIASSGLKMLVTLWKSLRDVNADFVLAGLQPRVQQTLQMIGLDQVFTIYQSAAEAADASPDD